MIQKILVQEKGYIIFYINSFTVSTKCQLWQFKTAVIVYRWLENDDYIVLIFGCENTRANLFTVVFVLDVFICCGKY